MASGKLTRNVNGGYGKILIIMKLGKLWRNSG